MRERERDRVSESERENVGGFCAHYACVHMIQESYLPILAIVMFHYFQYTTKQRWFNGTGSVVGFIQNGQILLKDILRA